MMPENRQQPGPGTPFDPESVRKEFPALAIEDAGRPRIYLDNPAGTQVPRSVARRMSACLLESNANLGGFFETSARAGKVADDARLAMADFLNAESTDEIVFGQNMTSLTLHLSRSIGRHLRRGDEIIVTHMDHDANVQPWVLMARDFGFEVRWLPFDTASCEFDLARLDEILSDRTRLVCVGGASNLTGTINDVPEIARRAREAGAWTFVDAVQSAPHVPTDVGEIGCDFLVCSAYKFFGPHLGILWGRREILSKLEPYKVRPAPDELPWCFETGTQSIEGMAGTAAAVDYFASLGERGDRRERIRLAMERLFGYEQQLSKRLVQGLARLPGVTVHGITEADAMHRRVPTVAFTHARHSPDTIARSLAESNVFVWSGHNYAVGIVDALGLADSGGVVRVGPVHYNTLAEIDEALGALAEILDA